MSPVGGARTSFPWRLAAIALLGLALRAWGVSAKPILPDDRAATESAIQFVERSQIGATMWHHPRLRDLAIYASVSTLGPGRLGFVFPSLLLGILSIPVVGLLGRRIAGDSAGLLSAFLVAIDPLHVAYSCQAVQDVYTFFFGAAGVLLALRFAEGERGGWAVASGVAFGLGAASKWSVAFPLAVVAAWMLARAARASPDGRRLDRIAFAAASFVVVPITVYLATWAPWLLGGHDLGEWLALQRSLAAEASAHGGFNPAMAELPHRAWQWFVMPVAHADFGLVNGAPEPIVAITNPVVWLLTIPAVGLALRDAWEAGGGPKALLVALFAASYAPFLPLSRPIWLHSALAVLPFAFVAVAALIVELGRRRGRPRAVLGAYVALALVPAAPLFLLATGQSSRAQALQRIAERYRPSVERERFDVTPAP